MRKKKNGKKAGRSCRCANDRMQMHIHRFLNIMNNDHKELGRMAQAMQKKRIRRENRDIRVLTIPTVRINTGSSKSLFYVCN